MKRHLSMIEHHAAPRFGRFASSVRIKGCFVIGHGNRAKRLHLPAETCVVWRHGTAHLVAETKCNTVLENAATLLDAPDHLTMCDECALADHMPYIVYRFFDAADELLYVGYSANFPVRIKAHRVGQIASPWFPLVARWTLVSFDAPAPALAYEASAIRTERPLYNIRHKQAVAA